MGTKERKLRAFETREQAILATARELIAHEGLLNLQMARLAEKCDCAVGTLYQHFACKEDLLLALVCQDVEEHAHLFERVAAWDAPSRDRVFAIIVADTVFVRNNPEHFRIAQFVFCELVWNAASPARREALMQQGEPIRDTVVGIVESAVAAGDLDLRGLTPGEVTASLWCLSSGVHDLAHAAGVLQHFAVNDPYSLMCRQMQAFLNGLDWKPLVDSGDVAQMAALIERIRNEVFHDCCRKNE